MFQTGRVIGMPVTVSSAASIVEAIIREAKSKHSGYVCVANVHMITTASRNEKLRCIMEKAFIVTADGLPLVWRLKQSGFAQATRVTGTDLTLRLCEKAADEGVPVCFYGGTMETIQALQKSIINQYPKLNVVYFESPPVLPEQPEIDQGVVDRINKSGARIVFVGLGCPKQEYWMAEYTSQLPAVLIGVGAAFDFIAGTVNRAPVWMQNAGLEWLHRLVVDPRKTWKRYLTTNPLFVWMVIKEYVKRKA